ncbi:hypothetical protein ARAF_1600 [Arsenophonus endosymbiont of Aleurodicus floccissimus]|uniref:aldolase/citrate lyase family protein n=1 Tax=Arsenophonus endosymbiont of Aleurodicus floccissimus TaxID=2152761 RepID=UPI000ED2C6E8|nr:aldolase/citrate lyase family protein [Arsenophonus endosymbiont of Aleurodicus floccissimus]SPP31932.1 hypothetical protein ARAF_1600 [Arsenophonus endosymbiont of Aleurodicus floccissimus]
MDKINLLSKNQVVFIKEDVTYLFVLANKKELFTKALECGVDVIIIDLEDSVHPSEKTHGRENIVSWFAAVNRELITTKIYIKINHPECVDFIHDVEMLNSLVVSFDNRYYGAQNGIWQYDR